MAKLNVDYNPAIKSEPNKNIEAELASRYKLENMYLKKQIEEKNNELIEKDKIISKLNRQLLDLNKYIEKLSVEHKSKEEEIARKYEIIEQLIEPEPIREKNSVLSKILDYFDIKVSYT